MSWFWQGIYWPYRKKMQNHVCRTHCIQGVMMILTLHIPTNKGVRMITQMHTCAHIQNTIRPNNTYNIVYIPLGISPASNCSWPTFRNPVSVPSSKASSLWRWNWHRVPKRRPTTIWRRGNTQRNIYNIQITAKVWNLEFTWGLPIPGYLLRAFAVGHLPLDHCVGHTLVAKSCKLHV